MGKISTLSYGLILLHSCIQSIWLDTFFRCGQCDRQSQCDFGFGGFGLHSDQYKWKETPLFIKFIMTPVEFLGLFIKPITLMFRLFGNIVAGHMVVVVFVGLIFVFGQNGANAGAAYGTAAGSILLTMFMMAIELLVAFIQAFVFTILTASYIGAAIEEHHEH
jgi:F0F1-type ATP synthase membrane subunit a